MKLKLFALSLVFAIGFALAAPTEVKLIGNEALNLPVMRINNADVYLDSSERDTSNLYLNLLGLHQTAYNDTIGHVHMRCDDSSGTDSVGAKLYWQGNYMPRGGSGGIGGGPRWVMIDSMTVSAGSGVETNQQKAVVNGQRFMSMRFILINPMVPDVAKKTVCSDIVLNRHKRVFK